MRSFTAVGSCVIVNTLQEFEVSDRIGRPLLGSFFATTNAVNTMTSMSTSLCSNLFNAATEVSSRPV